MEKQKQNMMWRFYVVVLLMFLFAIAIVTKIFIIQWVEGPVFEEWANAKTIKNVPLRPSRGNIYASDGSILATSVPRYELRWDAVTPSRALFEENKESLSKALSAFLKRPKATILKKMTQARAQKNRYWLVAKG